MKTTFLRACAASLFALTPLLGAAADVFPSRPIKMIVPFAPGGSTDVAARIVGAKMSELLGTSVVVENLAGGGTVIATRAVAESAPDGHTVLFGTNTLALNPTLRPNLSYDTLKDLRSVGMIARQPFVLAVNPSVPANTVAELVQYAKANPGKINYGSAGTATGNHLAQELFSILSGTQLTHVPYRGDGPMVIDLLAGRLQMTISTIPSLMPQIQAGKLRALGVADDAPLAQLPNVPPISRSGVPGFVATAWNAMIVRAGTPQPIVDKLSQTLRQALEDPKVRQALEAGGAVPNYMPAAQFDAYLAAEIKRWGEIIRTRDIKAE